MGAPGETRSVERGPQNTSPNPPVFAALQQTVINRQPYIEVLTVDLESVTFLVVNIFL